MAFRRFWTVGDPVLVKNARLLIAPGRFLSINVPGRAIIGRRRTLIPGIVCTGGLLLGRPIVNTQAQERSHLLSEDTTSRVYGSPTETALIRRKEKAEEWIAWLIVPLAPFGDYGNKVLMLAAGTSLVVGLLAQSVPLGFVAGSCGSVYFLTWLLLVKGWQRVLAMSIEDITALHAARPFSSLPDDLRVPCYALEAHVLPSLKDHYYFSSGNVIFKDYRTVNYRPDLDELEYRCTITTDRSPAAERMHGNDRPAVGYLRVKVRPSNITADKMDMVVEFYPEAVLAVKYPFTHTDGDRIHYLHVAERFEDPAEPASGVLAWLSRKRGAVVEMFSGLVVVRIPALFQGDPHSEEALPPPPARLFYESS